MTAETVRTLAELRQQGRRRFARWDEAVFDALAAGPAVVLDDGLRGQPDAAAVLAAYLRLAQEAAGTGLLRPATAAGRGTFLERLLVELVPTFLPVVPAGERLSALIRAWNAAEGLGRQPAWLDRYVSACAARLHDLADMETFLTDVLAPVLQPPTAASWGGPFTVTVLDLRGLHEEFLPGELALAGPTVLRVDDRRRAGLQTGVLLRPGGRSELLGLTDGLGDYADEAERPTATFPDGRVAVGVHAVEVPALRRCHRHVVARAGFIAACVVDSQRLWIVESP
jgi:hypothetical protein